MPDRTSEFKTVDCHGSKKSKERITVLVCANISGMDKVPLFVLGKAAKLRCFKNVELLPTELDPNTKAGMTGEIFTRWVKMLDMKCHCQHRRKLPCSPKA